MADPPTAPRAPRGAPKGDLSTLFPRNLGSSLARDPTTAMLLGLSLVRAFGVFPAGGREGLRVASAIINSDIAREDAVRFRHQTAARWCARS